MLIVITPNGKDSRTLYERLTKYIHSKFGVTDVDSEIYVTFDLDATIDLDKVIAICEEYGVTELEDT